MVARAAVLAADATGPVGDDRVVAAFGGIGCGEAVRGWVGLGAVAASVAAAAAPASALAALRAPKPRARPKRTESIAEV